MSFWFGWNLAPHHAQIIVLCWCLVSSSLVYCILSTKKNTKKYIVYDNVNNAVTVTITVSVIIMVKVMITITVTITITVK